MIKSMISMFIKSVMGMSIIIVAGSFLIYHYDMLDSVLAFFQNVDIDVSEIGKNVFGIFEEDDYETWKCEEWEMLDECKK